jgi:hypothetical protein
MKWFVINLLTVHNMAELRSLDSFLSDKMEMGEAKEDKSHDC